jgi:hypothetical protein
VAPQSIKRIFFDAHSYICFDDKVYIHDPDCGCSNSWVGSIIGVDGKIKDTIYIIRNSRSDHD